MISGIQTAAYVFASILFILSLGGLSSIASSKQGVLYGILGMLVAIVATVFGKGVEGHVYIIAAIVLASFIGIILAQRVKMESMPQLVAILHSFVGLAAVLVGIGSYLDVGIEEITNTEKTIHLTEVFIGVFIGAITFTGSIVAWGKLEGKISSKSLIFKGRHLLNIILVLVCVVLGICFVISTNGLGMNYLIAMTLIAGLIGYF